MECQADERDVLRGLGRRILFVCLPLQVAAIMCVVAADIAAAQQRPPVSVQTVDDWKALAKMEVEGSDPLAKMARYARHLYSAGFLDGLTMEVVFRGRDAPVYDCLNRLQLTTPELVALVDKRIASSSPPPSDKLGLIHWEAIGDACKR
jgi:hypothetical protein